MVTSMRKLFLVAALMFLLLLGIAGARADSTPAVIITTASSNKTFVQAGATRITMMSAVAVSGTVAYVHIYDTTAKNAAGFSCGGTNELHIWPVPASATGNGFIMPQSESELYPDGLAFCVTGAGTAGDTSNAPTGVYVNYDYR